MRHNASERPDVITFPPLIYLGAIGLSFVARFMFRRLPIAPKWLAGPRRKAGFGLITAGMGIMAWGAGTFQKAGTNISTHQPALTLVEEGPYRYTRNPIYIGMTAAYSGITLLLNNLWGLLLLPPLLTFVERNVIEREEAHLRARFGDAYDEFTERIPRWL
jgi:protein-S-isoprenylcysteine O-methyltransferase Ste14